MVAGQPGHVELLFAGQRLAIWQPDHPFLDQTQARIKFQMIEVAVAAYRVLYLEAAVFHDETDNPARQFCFMTSGAIPRGVSAFATVSSASY
jgi:hypothetical protein